MDQAGSINHHKALHSPIWARVSMACTHILVLLEFVFSSLFPPSSHHLFRVSLIFSSMQMQCMGEMNQSIIGLASWLLAASGTEQIEKYSASGWRKRSMYYGNGNCKCNLRLRLYLARLRMGLGMGILMAFFFFSERERGERGAAWMREVVSEYREYIVFI